jgi:DNA-binding response OmpR family regulator
MKNKRVLIVDDDENVIEIVGLYLRKEGAISIPARDGGEALEKTLREQPDLIVLDIMLPGMAGWQVCRKLREEGIDTPIIMLTAKGEDYDKLLGFELGADDYVTKPFNPAELMARAKAILRRTSWDDDAVEYPGLRIDRSRYEVMVDMKVLPFTPKEIELLWHLTKRPGRVFTREELLQSIWGYDYLGDMRTVDVHVKRIREKLAYASDPPWRLKTVWGVGYKFEVDGNV